MTDEKPRPIPALITFADGTYKFTGSAEDIPEVVLRTIFDMWKNNIPTHLGESYLNLEYSENIIGITVKHTGDLFIGIDNAHMVENWETQEGRVMGEVRAKIDHGKYNERLYVRIWSYHYANHRIVVETCSHYDTLPCKPCLVFLYRQGDYS